MLRLALIALLMLSACTPQQNAPSPTPQPVPQSSAPPGVRAPALVAVDLYERGLRVEIPAGWTWDASYRLINRATQRYFLAANGPLTDLPGLPGNGDVDASALPSGRVVVEVESFCRFACSGPAGETPFPLGWSTAAPLFDRTLPSGRRELAVGFRWFDQPLFAVARWADDAAAADLAAIADVMRSIRPEPAPPATGEYRGWAGLGPAASIPVGGVRLEPLPAGAILRPPYRTYDNRPFFVVRGKANLFAFASGPMVGCEIHYEAGPDVFSCTRDGRRLEWTRFGRYLGPEPASDLLQHRVIIRDGLVWVHYNEDRGVSAPDEAPER